jgi:hypothetical protein
MNPGPPPPMPPQGRVMGHDGRENIAPAKPKKPGVGARIMKALIQNAVMIASMVVTYYVTQTFLSSSLQAQFGDMGRQIGPAIISIAVGGTARAILGAVMH